MKMVDAEDYAELFRKATILVTLANLPKVEDAGKYVYTKYL